MLSLYIMPVKIRKQIDRIRRRFLWQGNACPRKKYSLVNWDLVCYPKDYGGLGVKDLNLMNISLLVKWWWKWSNPQYTGLWKQILLLKYNSHTQLNEMSHFWREVTKLQYIGQLSCSFKRSR